MIYEYFTNKFNLFNRLANIQNLLIIKKLKNIYFKNKKGERKRSPFLTLAVGFWLLANVLSHDNLLRPDTLSYHSEDVNSHRQ